MNRLGKDLQRLTDSVFLQHTLQTNSQLMETLKIKPTIKKFKELDIIQINKNKMIEQHDVLGQTVPYSDPKSVYHNPKGDIVNEEFYETVRKIQIKRGIDFCNEYGIPIKKKYLNMNLDNYKVMLNDLLNISNTCLFDFTRYDCSFIFPKFNNNSKNIKIDLNTLVDIFNSFKKYYSTLKSKDENDLLYIFDKIYNKKLDAIKNKIGKQVDMLWSIFYKCFYDNKKKSFNNLKNIYIGKEDYETYKNVLELILKTKIKTKIDNKIDLGIITNIDCVINQELINILEKLNNKSTLFIRIEMPLRNIYQVSMIFLIYNLFSTIKFYKSHTVLSDTSYIICSNFKKDIWLTKNNININKCSITETPPLFIFELERIMNAYVKEMIIDIMKITNFIDDKENFQKIEKKYLDKIINKKNNDWVKKYL
jgi:hypothetical protein